MRVGLVDEVGDARAVVLVLHAVGIAGGRHGTSGRDRSASIARERVRLVAKGAVLAKYAVNGRVTDLAWLVEARLLDRTLGSKVGGGPLRVLGAFFLEEAE